MESNVLKDIASMEDAPTVRLGRIGYVNVDPIYYGLEHVGKPGWMRIVSAPPAVLNQKLGDGDLDISAVSAFAYTRHRDDWLILPDFCVACAGNVMSVLLVSRFPMADLSGKRLYVTDESATAVSLIRLVLKMHQVFPVYETGKINCPQDIHADDGAALVIGDTAMKGNWHGSFPYVWDLGDLWSELTGLPFVFALWAVRRSFAKTHPEAVSAVLNLLRESRRVGMRNLDAVSVNASAALGVDREVCEKYFKNFCFDLKRAQIKGLNTFFQYLHQEGFFDEAIPLSFFQEI